MRIGFTGTRHGMSLHQIDEFTTLLMQHNPTEFRLGMCEGADMEAHAIVNQLIPSCKIIPLPGVPGTYLKRNREIVDNSDLLIAAPLQNTHPETKHAGGTWYTIDYAHKQGKPLILLTK